MGFVTRARGGAPGRPAAAGVVGCASVVVVIVVLFPRFCALASGITCVWKVLQFSFSS